MGRRIVFEFSPAPAEHDACWERVRRTLETHGATNVRAPRDPLPGIATAVLPDDTDLEPVLQELRSTEGVGRVEEDAPRWSG